MSKPTIVFDLGGVLLTDGTASAFEVLERLFEIPARQARELWSTRIREPLERGLINEGDFWSGLARLSRGAHPVQVRDAFLGEFRPIPYGIAALHEAHAAGYRTALAANHITGWMDRWRSCFAWFGLLDPVVCSDAIYAAKPETSFFRTLTSRLGETPLLLFDDTPAHVQAARRCGIRAEIAAGEWWASRHFETGEGGAAR